MAAPKQPSKKTVPPASGTLFDRLSGRKQDIACIVILYALVKLLPPWETEEHAEAAETSTAAA